MNKSLELIGLLEEKAQHLLKTFKAKLTHDIDAQDRSKLAKGEIVSVEDVSTPRDHQAHQRVFKFINSKSHWVTVTYDYSDDFEHEVV